jgi:predicted DCC family thiol-disulfide oxidoreductase YuxK
MDAPYEKVLLFDGACVLCSRSVRFVLAREKRPEIRFVAAQTPAGQAMLDHFGLPRTDWDSVVFVVGGKPRFKSDAFFAVIRHLRFPWPLMAGFRIVPRVLRDWVYDRIARNRYDWFGRRDACFVPGPDQAHRFLGLATGDGR